MFYKDKIIYKYVVFVISPWYRKSTSYQYTTS